jgi:hypothetical protein
MKTTMLKQALLVVSLAGLTSAASAALLGLSPGGTLQSGDKLFSDFTWTGPDMTVTAIGNGSPGDLYGIQVAGALAQNGPGGQDYQLGYKVTVVGGLLISDIHEYANIDVGGAGFVDVSEDARTTPSGLAVAHAGVSSINIPASLTATMNLIPPGPLQTVWVTKDILLNVGPAGGFASVSIIDQTFSQVPEPATCLAGLGGVLLLALGSRRHR